MTHSIAAGCDIGTVAAVTRGGRADGLMRLLCWTALAIVALTLGALILLICNEAWPALAGPERVWALLVGRDWAPLLNPPQLGIRHAILSTVMVTALSLALAVPLGFGIGLFVAELAPRIIRNLLQPCFELLAGIPSVVYGFFGYVTLVAWFERYGGMATGESLLVASLALLAGCPSKPKDQPEQPQTPTTSDTSGLDTSPVSSDETAIQGPSGELLSQRIVYFDFDRADIRADSQSVVSAHAAFLSKNPNVKVRLEGHADERGSREYNIGLGERRAQAVRRVLMLQGASGSQLTTVSYGEERPAQTGSDEEAWRLNRRVELVYR